MNEKTEAVRDWLVKAQHDLLAARKLASDPDPLRDVAVYHCQQAAEKAIKGFLVWRDVRFDKVHDLEVLLRSAALSEERFAAWTDAGEQLTPYASEFRYPGPVMEPERDEVQEALRLACGIYDFVLSLLPDEVRPKS